MPIKGISDIRRFSRGGKIRLGEKRKSQGGKEYPAKLDYFLFDPEDERLLPVLQDKFGDKPRRLKVAFPSDDASVVYPQWYKLYSATGLVCKGDGENASRVVDKGAMVDVECPGPDVCKLSLEKGLSGRPGCKRVASLQFFLTELDQLFVWQIDTTSFHSIVNINSGLDLLKRIAGRISFVEVDLLLKPQTIQPDGKKQVAYVLDLQIGLHHLNALRPLVGPHAMASLPPPSERTPDDLYPAAQIGYDGGDPSDDDDPPVDPETGEVQEATAVPVDDDPYNLEPTPEPAKQPEPPAGSVPKNRQKPAAPAQDGQDITQLPEVLELSKKRPAVARAILGQALGEGWDAEQVLALVRKKLEEAA